MQENYQTTKAPTVGSNSGPGYPPNASWSNPSRITTDDGSSASIGFFEGGQDGDSLIGSSFGFSFPPGAVIDGIAVTVDGSQTGSYGSIYISPALTGKDIGSLNETYGGENDLWGADEITPADLSTLSVQIDTADVSGGDGIASVDYLEVTVFWHIEPEQIETEVPTRIDYKVYSRDGNYLGLLPNVTSKLAFPEDINSAGTSIVITCGKKVENPVTATPLLTEGGDVITTEDDLPILATETELQVTTGDSPDEAIFKNSNRVKAWLYNKYYPNGRLMFSGQINRVNFKYGGGDATVALTVYSDGLDLNNFVARGYPFSYTTDVTQNSQNGVVTVTQGSKDASWRRYGQTWRSGGSANNIGAIVLKLKGTANVTISVYQGGRPGAGGSLIGSVTKSVAVGSATNIQFEFAQLIPISPNTEYFMAISVNPGKTITVYRHSSSSTYTNGTQYRSDYAGGSGGGLYYEYGGDLFFLTKYGAPTTTATYSSQDPVTGMGSGIFLDYNARGGLITERDFEATGLSLTYTFVVAFIYDALKKILELCPTGYYAYIDVGTAEIDIKQTSETPDFTVVRGRHINELNIDLTIEQVKNYFLFTGGESGGNNLFREYSDSQSSSLYGIRTAAKTDNRVTLTPTADAIGDTFIEENADEQQETSLVVLNQHIDITKLTPGKTIGFKNFGNFIDNLVLQIVRREGNYSDGVATLTLGRLPVRMNDMVQQINRQLLDEQTINNPSAPS